MAWSAVRWSKARAWRAAVQSLALVFVMVFAACSNNTALKPATTSPGATVTTTGTSTPVAPAGSPTSSATPGGGPASPADAQAIKAVIQRANDEQQQAVATLDPTLIRDTATADYYAQSVQILDGLANTGVTAIKLTKLEWGAITVSGANAQATTVETWQVAYADGTTDVNTNRNVYSLVKQGGGWLISADVQPDSRLNQPPPSSGPAPTTAAGSGVSTSRNWAGYAASGGPFTAVTGTWTVPAVASSSTVGSADATWVGIGGLNTTDLIQAGTDASVLGPGQVRYTAWVETLPQPSQPVSLAVTAGDVVQVSITQQSAGTWQVTIANQTTGKRYQTTVQYSSTLSSVEWIEEAPSTSRMRVVALDNFGSVQIQGTAVLGGKQVTIAGANSQPITMSGRNGQPIAVPSALAPDGKTFTVTRQ